MESLNERNNFIYLTCALVTLLVSSALIDMAPPGLAHRLLQCVVLGTYVVAYLSLNFGIVWRRFVAAMVVALLVSNAAHESIQWQFSGALDLMIMLTFFTGVAVFAARRVLFSGVVNLNTIVGSLAIYLLLGLMWACLYLLALEFSAAAFNGIEYQNWTDNFPVATYFSYVTLTSLGYGEISPAEPVSRVLVYLEAITSMFYMAIVVASLINARNTSNSH